MQVPSKLLGRAAQSLHNFRQTPELQIKINITISQEEKD